MPTIKVTSDISQVVGRLSADLQKQVPYAAKVAINNVAKQVLQELKMEEQRVFDRPSPYALRAFKIYQYANKAELTAIVGLRDDAPGKGQTWERSLAHEVTGGDRHWRRFESALWRIGILPAGMAVVPPAASSWAVKLDAYGNIQPSLIVVLLSYFQAFGEQGFRANSTAKSRAKRAKFSTNNGFKAINGVVYFVSTGKDNMRQFAPGIWAKRGTHGVDVAPVMLFVRTPRYKARLDFEGVTRKTVDDNFSDQFTTALEIAMATAK